MSESRFELSVGDSIQFDEQVLTVLEICGEEITFRLDSIAENEPAGQSSSFTGKTLPPR